MKFFNQKGAIPHQGAEDREVLGDVDKADEQREDGQDDQREGHGGGALGRVCCCFGARLAEEGHGDLAHGVERRQERADHQHHEDQGCQPVAFDQAVIVGIGEDLVFAPEAGGDEWEAGQRQAADQECDKCDRHARAQTAHVAHVLRVECVCVIAGVFAVFIVAVVRVIPVPRMALVA